MARNQLKADRAADMETQDFRDALAPRLPDVEDDMGDAAAADTVPSLQPYISASDSNMKAMPLVSISVNQSVPIRDVLFELAQQADYDLELDPRIKGSIIFTARERPFDDVVERIADIAGLRFKFENDVLRVELDTPYNKVYKIDYLSYIRSNTSNVRNDIGVVSGDGADTGSSFETTATSEANFWGELEVNIQQILGSAEGAVLRTQRDPRITATEQNPNVQPVAATDAQGNPVTSTEGVNVQAQAPQAVLNVQSLPTEEEEAASNNGSQPEDNVLVPTFTLNKQAGLLNVYAPQRAQKEVDEYLKLVRRAVTAQVLIEAKILEVVLDDEHATGIDWRALDLGDLNLNYLTSTGAATLAGLGPNTGPSLSSTITGSTSSNLVVGSDGGDFQALIKAISGFGTVRALASPRLTVLNNQSAVLNVADNRVFFEIDIDVTTDEGVSQVDIDSDIRNVPEGVLVNVQPSINLDNGTISMALRPTITRITALKRDPAVEFVKASAIPPITNENVISEVPELNVQEIDSVIQVRSGQAVVLGGLLQDRIEGTQTGVPVMSEVPIVGSLFRQHNDIIHKQELVIFLKATILPSPDQSIHDTDRDIYRAFSGDRRPFKL
ncbi:MAG: type II and III secretion system family protein [Alphaproteobacteria bacterium]